MVPRHWALCRNKFKWLLHLVGFSSTLLLLLVYFTLVDVVRKSSNFSDPTRAIQRKPVFTQILTPMIDKRLENTENDLFKIHKFSLSSQHRRKLELNSTGSIIFSDGKNIIQNLTNKLKVSEYKPDVSLQNIIHNRLDSQTHIEADQLKRTDLHQQTDLYDAHVPNATLKIESKHTDARTNGSTNYKNMVKHFKVINDKKNNDINVNVDKSLPESEKTDVKPQATDKPNTKKIINEQAHARTNGNTNDNNKVKPFEVIKDKKENNIIENVDKNVLESKTNGKQPPPLKMLNDGGDIKPLGTKVELRRTDVKLDKLYQQFKAEIQTTAMPDLDSPPTSVATEVLTTGNNLMILSYMRSGSSMNGNVFRDTEDNFYVYEPLIKYAPYHYFTENRLCKMREPKCMRTDLDGYYVEDRINGAIRTLKNIYSCNIRGLDDRTLRSIMFENKSGKHWSEFTRCFYLVAENRTFENFDSFISNSKDKEFDKHKNVLKYLRSTGKGASLFNTCMEKLETKCRNSSIRVTKVLRLSVRLLPRLLHMFSNLKLLFVLRDPRGIMNSRIQTPWFPVSRDKPKEVLDNIKSLCYKMESDVKMVQSLKRDFPGRLKDVPLEDIVQNPSATFSDIFEFMNVTMTDSHRRNINNIFRAKPNFQTKWVISLNKELIRVTEERCRIVFSYYRYFTITQGGGS